MVGWSCPNIWDGTSFDILQDVPSGPKSLTWIQEKHASTNHLLKNLMPDLPHHQESASCTFDSYLILQYATDKYIMHCENTKCSS